MEETSPERAPTSRPAVLDGRPVRALLLDLDDTLIDRAAAFRRWLEDLLARHPAAFPAPAADLAALLALDDGGRRDRRSFYEGLLARHEALVAAGFTPERLQADLGERLEVAVAPDPRVVAAVARLRARGVRLAVVTNGPSQLQRRKLARSGVEAHLDAVVVSGEVGVSKPDPAIFAHALAALDVAAADAVMVGDDPRRDVVGGAAVGLRTVWVSRGAPWPQGPDFPPPTATIDETWQLEAALSGP